MITSDPVDSLEPIVEPKTSYVYYLSSGSIIKSNVDDSADRSVITRTGATNYIMDTRRNTIFYVLLNRNILKEVLGGKKEVVLTSSGKITDVKYNAKKQILYFVDAELGQIESYDLKTQKRTVLYRGLNKPQTLKMTGR